MGMPVTDERGMAAGTLPGIVETLAMSAARDSNSEGCPVADGGQRMSSEDDALIFGPETQQPPAYLPRAWREVDEVACEALVHPKLRPQCARHVVQSG